MVLTRSRAASPTSLAAQSEDSAPPLAPALDSDPRGAAPAAMANAQVAAGSVPVAMTTDQLLLLIERLSNRREPIPITGKLRPKEIHCHYAGSHKKLKDEPDIFGSTVPFQSSNITTEKIQKDQEFCKNPNLEKVTLEKSRILDLREKLNEIAKNQENNVDKKTKGLINNITQQLGDDKDQDESGPYSLLFDLHSDPSTSSKDTRETQLWNVFEVDKDNDMCAQTFNNLVNPVNRSLDKLPNVINLENKPMREFEYSCESDVNFPVKKTFNTHSRSDLCLQLKSHLNLRTFETTLSPNDNSLNRTNDENSLDDSLGILTPDQMDDICYLENTFSPTVEGLPIFCDNSESKISPENGDSPSTDKTESNSAASTIQNDGFEKNNTKLFEFKTGLAPIASVESSTCNDPTIFTLFDNVESTNKDYETSFESVQSSTNNVIVPLIKTNESAQEDGSDVLKEEFIPSLIDEEFLPSIHSSILEPISSIAETTNNLDLPLNCKNDNLVVHRIEQTPSPEDLPLDSSDINGEISTYSQFSSSTLHESQTYSDPKNEYPKSMETSKVSNSFITSITSITSLDGYQGDGEMSRPVSRGADQSMEPREDAIEMDWQNVPVTRRADPMTDSDFFTESDADGLDDNMQRGDRRAQVIDGALYGGKNVNGNPLIVNRNDDSCMESSGVYTDFENQRASPVFLNVIDDMSPEGSTISTHSECSQKNASNASVGRHCSPSGDTREQNLPNMLEDSSSKINSKRNSLKSEKDLKCNEKTKEEKRSFTLKKYKMPKRDVPSKLKTMLANRKTDGDASTQSSPKVVKAPGRDNLIKKNPLDLKTDYKAKSFKDIKSKVDGSFSLQRSQTSCSVSRMLTSKSTNTNAKPKSRHIRMRMDLASTNGSGKSSLHSSQSDVSATSSPLGKHTSSRFPAIRNGKKRDGVQTPTTPARPQPTPPQPPTTQAKKNGVVQKLSFSPVALRARTSLVPPPSPRKPTPRRTPAQRPNTLPTNVKEPPRVAAAVAPRGKRVQTPQPTRTPPPPPAPLVAPLPAQPRDQSFALAHAAKGVEALGVLVQYLVFRLDALNGGAWRQEAERWRSVAAAEHSSAARADRDRQQRAQKDLDTIAECLSKISELEMEVSSKEEINARLQATHIEEVAALADDIKGLKDTIDSLKREVAESRTRLHAHSEIERTLRAQLEAARKETQRQNHDRPDTSCDKSVEMMCDKSCDTSCDMSCNMCDAACDPVVCEAEECELRLSEELSTDANELAAEVRSLRAVIELKQAEMASLRDTRTELAAERERRAALERESRAARHAAEELRERAAARQREADRLKDELRRLRDAAARDRDHATRLAALNEELRYKLRQKSQVVSLLAGSGYIESHRGMRARTSSGDSGRSASPPPDSPPSPASSPAPDSPPLPAVKGVVEKHDSVSWVLEIEETPEEVASRLARKSSFRNGASQSGVKRRGGGSPGSTPAPASPAPNASKLFRPGDIDFPPAPPPLKESAGEAIYIYDDRQY